MIMCRLIVLCTVFVVCGCTKTSAVSDAGDGTLNDSLIGDGISNESPSELWEAGVFPAELLSDGRDGFVNIFDVWGVDENAIWAVGSEGRILFYDGEQWTKQDTPTSVQLNAVWGTRNGEEVWAVGFSGTILFFDGSVWRDRSPPTEIYVEADASVPAGDAGVSLRRNLWGVWATGGEKGTTTVIAVGDRGTVLRQAQDGSGAWIKLPTEIEEDLSAVWSADGVTFFSVGDFGTILIGSLSDFRGIQRSGVSKPLRAVWGRSSNDVFAAGIGGTILHYNGSKWCDIGGAPPLVFRDIWAPRGLPQTYFVGWDGVIATLGKRPPCGSDGAFRVDFGNTRHRLEGIWGTFIDDPEFDAGVRVPAGDAAVDVEIPQTPKAWIVGTSGVLVEGP